MTHTAPPPFSFRQAYKLIRKLSLHNGDILLIKSGTALATKEGIDLIINACENMNIDGIVLVVDDFNDLSKIDQKEMMKHGWYHLEHLKRMLDKSRKKSTGTTDEPEPA